MNNDNIFSLILIQTEILGAHCNRIYKAVTTETHSLCS